VFQPVFEIGGAERRVHFVECLTRGPSETNTASAGVLFEYARRKGKECTLDRLCVQTILETAAHIPGQPSLSINVHASTFERDADFAALVLREADRRGIDHTRLILEIIEHAPAFGGPRFLRALAELRRHGLRLALDDIGLGQSNYRMILECHPDYFKVDAYLVQGCHGDVERQAILDSLVQLARRFGSRVVAEGIETHADLLATGLLGIDLVQGYLLARPASASHLSNASSARVPA
jgi:EAL domain-containing protein (putative c-di-GMP-specific phosphodiesterase class I)